MPQQRTVTPPPGGSVAEIRARYRAACAAFGGERVPLPRVEDTRAAGVPVRLYEPAPEAPLLVYFHGGRFISGDLETHDALCRRLAAESGWSILAVDYRLAPEHPYPAALEDALAVVASVPALAVGGDSAGANLALGAAAQQGGRLAAQLLLYPMLDPACASASHREFAHGPGPSGEDMRLGWELYRQPPMDIATDGLPRALVLTCSHDPLRDEGIALAKRLYATHLHIDGMPHGFLTRAGELEAAPKAISACAAWLAAVPRAVR